ncbi:DUF4876 domain-containing protein [Zunongwangia endophytica]|uniref:DUF4876 domain-containing protein n=1 Tax=Zunongwangia endophytica TaxID=1808945 RepID=A0ABV8H8W8_9FLAO|nr:DUF4876 domain-containing protein [Zunongwangia endophytica]MDN3593509.1 DUF4876 domain-containing protein [Zunongwangia endophytica]
MRKFYLLGLIGLLFLSCSDDDNFINVVSHQFTIDLGTDEDNKPAEEATISLENVEDGKTYNITTNASGNATIEVVPGTYNINVSKQYTAAEYEAFSGKEVTNEVIFNGSLSNVSISETNTTTEISLVTGQIGDLVFKQIYFSGSDVKKGALFRDQFVEIHNNSNKTIYLDGLYFAQIKGQSSISSTVRDYNLPNGQYDWSQSINQQDPDNANTAYVYAEEVLQIPGSGEEYPLASGQSVIIAATAVNHKAPLNTVDSDGEPVTYEVEDPSLTVDLSQAPFEAFYQDYFASTGGNGIDSDIDNPNSINLNIIFKTFKGDDLILDTNGREALVIFRANQEAYQQINSVPLPSINDDRFDEETSTYMQVPVEYVLDGVEIQNTDPAKPKPPRLPNSVDAGEIATISGKFSSESIIRKVKSDKDGKIFYQDTNNSSNDFEVLDRPIVEITTTF